MNARCQESSMLCVRALEGDGNLARSLEAGRTGGEGEEEEEEEEAITF